MSIKFVDAAFWYDQKQHQITAWDYLQENVDPAVLDKFSKIYRNQINVVSDSTIPLPGLKLIKKYEGLRLNAYYDPLTGKLPVTIGWGSTQRLNGAPFMIGDKITEEEAEQLLRQSVVKKFLPNLERIPYWHSMNENQRGALLSFAYNLGAYFYGDENFSTITRVLKNKEWVKVPDALYLYRNPGTRVEEGLAKRRMEEGKLWETPV
jgi:GH24 family phage-related lysozyme (muramidase)